MRRSSSLGSLVGKVTRPFRRLDSGIEGCRDATLLHDVVEEVGHWWYVVDDPDGIRGRVIASYNSPKDKACPRLTEGTIVEVCRRRKAGWTTWLQVNVETTGRTSNGQVPTLVGESNVAWVFDVSPKDRTVRLVEVDINVGEWTVRSTTSKRLPVQPAPALRFASAGPLYCSQGMVEPGDTLTVKKRVRVRETGYPVFMELQDGRGWVCSQVEPGNHMIEMYAVCATCKKEAADFTAKFCRSCGSAYTQPETEVPVRGHAGQSSNCSIAEGGGYGNSRPRPPLLYSSSSHSLGSQASSPTKLFMSATQSSPSSAMPSPFVGLRSAAYGDRGGSAVAETGEWTYVVLDPCGISLRSRPTYDQKQKVGSRVEEGELVAVVERRCGNGCKFLRLVEPQGWAFDRKPQSLIKSTSFSSKGCVRMIEVNVERGTWYYNVVNEMGVALRSRCSFSDSCRSGKGPLQGAMLEVRERVRIGDTTFLKLAESGMWVFDVKGSKQIMQGPVEFVEPVPGTVGQVISENGLALMSSPTTQKWSHTKLMILKGAMVNLIRFYVASDGTNWVYVSRASGAGSHEGWAPACLVGVNPVKDAPCMPSKCGSVASGTLFTSNQVSEALKAPSALSY